MSDDEGQPVAKRRMSRRTRIVILLLSAVVVVAVVAGAWVALYGWPNFGGPTGPGTVAEFSGDGNQTTADFTVGEDWEIRWHNEGNQFEMILVGPTSSRALMARSEPGSGTTVPRGSGTFHLEITAEGAWTVTIVQP
jgi:hypothetical protein